MSSKYEESNRHDSRSRARKEHIREWDRDKYSPSFLRERDLVVDIEKERQRKKKDIHRHKEDRSPSKDRKDKKKKDRSRNRERSTDEKSQERKKSKKFKKKKNKSSKHKKKSKQDSSSDSDDSDASSVYSDDSVKLLQRLEKEKLRLNEERKKKKEMLKANETAEEKRARRLREKQAKEHKRRERMGWDGEYQCYTNQDNPFGDSELTQTFVWGKKLTKEGVSVVSREELDAQNRQKQLENKIELEKVKRRRQEREQEREERELEASAAQRAREAAQMDGWARAEDAFHLQQARLRTQIRIRDGRAKPIDLLASYVGSEDSVDGLEMHEPYTYLNGLQAQDLEDLLEDIEVYKELEKDANLSYWEDMTTIVQDELGKLRRLGAAAQDGGASRRDGIHHAVAQDVTQVFRGKTGPQLQALREQIEAKISGKRDGVDIGYWESLLSQLKAHMARARLRDRHQNNLRRKLQLLKQEQGVETAPGAAQEPTAHVLKHDSDAEPESTSAEMEADEKGSGSGSGTDDGGEEMADEEACTAAYEAGGYEPRLQPAHTADLTMPIMTVEERDQTIVAKRAHLHTAAAAKHHAAVMQLEPPSSSSSVVTHNESGMEREARRGMGNDEAQFSVEQPLPEQPCLWSDKYRPRKPRYFNRVHTGFEWNKYNQTHYDMDNPPPKIVQGYKFNIFYPDLIDNNNTPSFSLKPCPDNPDFAVLRFIAGPPYEDIAFKIVNREWEYSYKRGFRCHFHNNIFQLWFHFKRYRYRR